MVMNEESDTKGIQNLCLKYEYLKTRYRFDDQILQANDNLLLKTAIAVEDKPMLEFLKTHGITTELALDTISSSWYSQRTRLSIRIGCSTSNILCASNIWKFKTKQLKKQYCECLEFAMCRDRLTATDLYEEYRIEVHGRQEYDDELLIAAIESKNNGLVTVILSRNNFDREMVLKGLPIAISNNTPLAMKLVAEQNITQNEIESILFNSFANDNWRDFVMWAEQYYHTKLNLQDTLMDKNK